MAILGVRPCWRPTIRTITPMMPTNNSGSITVEITKAFVRTRARYSRFQISPNLRILLRDLFDEDIVQGRLHELKTGDFDTILDGGFQNFLGVRAGAELGVNGRTVPVEALDHVRQLEEMIVPGVFDSDRVLSERLLDGFEFSGQNRPPVVNQADRIAHHLHLFHAVRGEDDSRALIAQLEHDVFDQRGVDGIQAREGSVQDEDGRTMEDGS